MSQVNLQPTTAKPAADEPVADIFARHIGEWIVVEITRVDAQGDPTHGRLLEVIGTDERLPERAGGYRDRNVLFHRPGAPRVAPAF